MSQLYRHNKTGETYAVICGGTIEKTSESCVVYENTVTGTKWVRPTAEFNDGRFTRLGSESDDPELAEPRDAIDDRIDEVIAVEGLLEKLIRHIMGDWFKCKSPATLKELQYGVDELIECTLSTPECMPIWEQVVRNETIEECAKELETLVWLAPAVPQTLRAMKKPIQTDHL